MTEKVKKSIRINAQLNTQLVQYAARTGESETLILEQALQRFFADQSQEYEKIAEAFLEKFDEKYKNYMTRVRLAARGADVNSQVMIEILNTLLFLQGVKGEMFLSTDKTEHEVLKHAKETIRERIARFKQRKDFEER
ncbi:hypothetical protein OBO34_11245 [Clostridiales Family XIII bacterium ASD5510]|uniref:Uncharacterized protein n=1 Tax=Hominibacterium faecale TaxID=2839743 RepID=A0A9J6QV03_9FIRM|nr:hypothetical protein [Hominibacterium faecale]MCU7378931.1 hypothetical protein [Hominibacterium faecale]